MIKLVKNIGWFLIYLFIGFISLFPLLWGFKTSLTPTYDYGIIPKSLTIEHYKLIFQNDVLYKYFFNSLKVALGSIVIIIPIALIAAYGLSRFKFKGKNIISISFLILPLLPSSAILVPIVSYFNKLHLYNTIAGVIIAVSVFNISLSIWMLRNFIDNTPRAIEEAALIDGLSSMGTLFRVTLPMIKPGLISVIVYIFIGTWNNYTFSYALTTSPDARVLSQAILAFIGSWGTNWGGLTAMGMIMIVPPVLFFLIFQKSFIAGMFGQSLK